MEAKQKKQLITISLAGAVLLAGLVAGFLVVQNGVFIQNRASTGTISCIPLKGTCTDQSGSPHTLEVKEKDSGRVVAAGTGTVTFDADPYKTYVCEVVSSADSTCRASSEMSGQACISPERNDPTPLPITSPPPFVPKPSETATPTVPARINVPSVTATPAVTVTSTVNPPTATATTKPGTATATSVPPTSGTGGSGITPTGLPTSGPTNAPTATAAVQATRAAATATQAAVQTQASNPSATKAASTTSLPASGNVHPALIFGMLSVFIIVLGLLF